MGTLRAWENICGQQNEPPESDEGTNQIQRAMSVATLVTPRQPGPAPTTLLAPTAACGCATWRKGARGLRAGVGRGTSGGGTLLVRHGFYTPIYPFIYLSIHLRFHLSMFQYISSSISMYLSISLSFSIPMEESTRSLLGGQPAWSPCHVHLR